MSVDEYQYVNTDTGELKFKRTHESYVEAGKKAAAKRKGIEYKEPDNIRKYYNESDLHKNAYTDLTNDYEDYEEDEYYSDLDKDLDYYDKKSATELFDYIEELSEYYDTDTPYSENIDEVAMLEQGEIIDEWISDILNNSAYATNVADFLRYQLDNIREESGDDYYKRIIDNADAIRSHISPFADDSNSYNLYQSGVAVLDLFSGMAGYSASAQADMYARLKIDNKSNYHRSHPNAKYRGSRR